ncbi:Peptidase A1 domain-containing protein [Psidium guajava]|nr:Peptidase A1 domain-containing protein [Psidium guajava]
MSRPIMMLPITYILLLLMIQTHDKSFSGYASPAAANVRLKLIHSGAYAPKSDYDQMKRIKELVHSDIVRRGIMFSKHRQSTRRKAWEKRRPRTNVSIEMPISSGRDYGRGQYFVEVKVGTPPQKMLLIADTGSELTWMSCRRRNRRRGFRPTRSSTFKTVPCSSRTCKIDLMDLFSLARCPTPSTPCSYDYRYSDGTGALGIFARETVTAEIANGKGRATKVEDVVVGCTLTIQGQNFQGADGVLGMAYGNYSFATRASRMFGGTFSYCLVDHLSHNYLSNYLTFGGVGAASHSPSLSRMRYTKLDLASLSPFYAVNVKGISINGAMLKIPSLVWAAHRGGGTIVDSGTSLMFLTEPAYRAVVGALGLALSKRLDRMKLEGGGPLEHCYRYNSTGSQSGFDESWVPRLAIHFSDGARFNPPVKSYVIDDAPGVKCLGFVSATWPGVSVIGNIMQQNHVWEFNLVQSVLGYAPSTCTPT